MKIVMQEDHIWILIAGKLTGEGSDVDVEELDMLLKDDPELKEKMETITAIWELSAGKKNSNAYEH